MKLILFSFIMAYSIQVNAQKTSSSSSSFCTDFNNGGMAGWKSNQGPARLGVSTSIEANGPGGVADKFLQGSDESGPSFVYNATDFKGDWTKHLGKCLCWNVKAINTGSGAADITPGFSIYIGNPNDPANATIRAAFYANFKINNSSGWKRLCAPIALLDASGNLPKNSYGEWKMIKGANADWNTLLSKVDVISYGFDYGAAQDEVYGVDNICLKECEVIGGGSVICGCPNVTNLIKNGDFEAGATGFTSKFTRMTNSFIPGTYTVVDGDGARALCNNWLSGSGCGKDGQVFNKFFAVNGQTGQQGGLTAWGQGITVETGKDYKLCFNAGNLRQCCFNVDPKISIVYNDGFQQKTIGPITVSPNNSPCNWLNYTATISIPANATPTVNLPINIVLDQSGLGDGNDLAIDNISLIQLKPMDRAATCWTSSEFPPDNTGIYKITANMTALPPNSGFYWEVALIERNGVPVSPIITVSNPSAWWSNPLFCDFNGYDGNTGQMTGSSSPGTFNINNRYRITRATWSDCNSWSTCSKTTTTDAAARRVKLVDDNKYILKQTKKD
jgi:hypothetical protein